MRSVSADSFAVREDNTKAQTPNRFYRAMVDVTDLPLRNVPKDFTLVPGMTVTADIVVGRRSIMAYILGGAVRTFDEGIARALIVLSRLFSFLRGGAADRPQPAAAAAAALYQAAGRGDADAQARLGTALEQGDGVLRSPVDAVAWYRRAAEQGHAQAQLSLARLYLRGCEEPLHDLSPETVAQLFPNGLSVDRDPARGAGAGRAAAAEQGIAAAQSLLGDLLAGGRGGDADYAEARRWYQAAAAQDDSEAQLGLGILAAGGYLGEADHESAAVWFEKAVAQGNVPACFYLAALYNQGLGVESDERRTVELTTRAARAASPARSACWAGS